MLIFHLTAELQEHTDLHHQKQFKLQLSQII